MESNKGVDEKCKKKSYERNIENKTKLNILI
jgi:hypothetical protein